MNTKTLIIGLDGLEYTYVDMGDYPNLKQVEYGKVRVPITDVGEPSTPIVWTSFVTGKQPEEHGIMESSTANNKTVNNILRWFESTFSNQTMRKIFITFTPIRLFLKRFNAFQTHMPQKNDIKVPTMFDTVEDSVSVSVPVLDTDVDTRYQGILDAIINPEKRAYFVDFLMKDFEKDQKEFDIVLNKYKLVMVHFQLPDLYGHIYCRNMKKITEL